MSNLKNKTLEIVGLDDGNNGRVCGMHPKSCGQGLKEGMHLKLIKSTLEVSCEVKELISNDEPITSRKRGSSKAKVLTYETTTQLKMIDCIKAHVWENGIEGCFVGTVAKPFYSIYKEQLNGRVVLVERMLRESDLEAAEQYDKQNNGLAMVQIIQ